MASSYHIAHLLTILLFLVHPYVMAVPILDQICEKMSCGKGSCKVDIGSPAGFTCECLSGWKHTISDKTFLPCLIPDCKINSTCQKPPATVPEIQIPNNSSLFDPCYFIYCGEGKCSLTSINTYSCKCNSGYNNFLNTPTLPCYSDCAFGSDCANLALNKGHGNSILPGKFQWMAISIFALVMNQLWK